MKKLKLFTLTCMLFASQTFAQVYSDKVSNNKNLVTKDSLKQEEYPYALPIWGQKTTNKGFHLPYSAGISLNYLWQESDLIISNLSVGFNNGPMTNIDQIVRFNSATSSATALNFRPDIWLFPFLNVYGIFAKAKTSTTIDAGVYIPDSSNNWNEIGNINTKAEFDAGTLGFGVTPSIGIKGFWMVFDMNVAWTDVSSLDKPVFTFIFDPRLGKTFKFKKPERNVALWIGACRIGYSSETSGSINLSDVISTDELQAKVDNGYAKLDESQTQMNDWWNDLTPAEQNNPANKAKYENANKAFDAAGNLLNGIDGAVSTIETSTVQYSLDKKLKDAWNFTVGAQFQFNKHFMIRGEYGFLGSRQQFTGGLQYRFGL